MYTENFSICSSPRGGGPSPQAGPSTPRAGPSGTPRGTPRGAEPPPPRRHKYRPGQCLHICDKIYHIYLPYAMSPYQTRHVQIFLSRIQISNTVVFAWHAGKAVYCCSRAVQ